MSSLRKSVAPKKSRSRKAGSGNKQGSNGVHSCFGLYSNDYVHVRYEVLEMMEDDAAGNGGKKREKKSLRNKKKFGESAGGAGGRKYNNGKARGADVGNRMNNDRQVTKKTTLSSSLPTAAATGSNFRGDDGDKSATAVKEVKFSGQDDENNVSSSADLEGTEAAGSGSLSSKEKKQITIPSMSPLTRTTYAGSLRASRERPKSGRAKRSESPVFSKWCAGSEPVDRALLTIETDVIMNRGGRNRKVTTSIPPGSSYAPMHKINRPASAGKVRASKVGRGPCSSMDCAFATGAPQQSPTKIRR